MLMDELSGWAGMRYFLISRYLGKIDTKITFTAAPRLVKSLWVPRNCKVEIASRAAAAGPSPPSLQPIRTAWQSAGSLSCRGPTLH